MKENYKNTIAFKTFMRTIKECKINPYKDISKSILKIDNFNTLSNALLLPSYVKQKSYSIQKVKQLYVKLMQNELNKAYEKIAEDITNVIIDLIRIYGDARKINGKTQTKIYNKIFNLLNEKNASIYCLWEITEIFNDVNEITPDVYMTIKEYINRKLTKYEITT